MRACRGGRPQLSQEIELEGHTDRQTDKQTDRQIARQPDRPTDRQTGRPADRRTGRRADGPTDKQTNREREREQEERERARETQRETERETERGSETKKERVRESIKKEIERERETQSEREREEEEEQERAASSRRIDSWPSMAQIGTRNHKSTLKTPMRAQQKRSHLRTLPPPLYWIPAPSILELHFMGPPMPPPSCCSRTWFSWHEQYTPRCGFRSPCAEAKWDQVAQNPWQSIKDELNSPVISRTPLSNVNNGRFQPSLVLNVLRAPKLQNQ